MHTIEPHTESDPAALLLQLLVAFGNVIGRGPHFEAEADRHGLNLFSVLVGETSKARKGTSLAHIRKLVIFCDPTWEDWCLQTGLSSGEGLIHAVRDPNPDQQDGGAMDKRAFIVESEFASPLRMISRDGNTLSPVLRQAWDGNTLQIMTKLSPAKATGAHISVIAHVTREELRRELTRTDAGSGFGNRFLWACVRRSKVLPDGGRLADTEFNGLANRLRKVVQFSASLGDWELRRDDQASRLWHSIYEELSEGRPGLLGAVTSRAEAQVMRVGCIYALFDKSKTVAWEHLSAALAVWQYCTASARYIFGDALGHPLADDILRRLIRTPEGLTRTQISIGFNRNRSKAEIDEALAFLAERGLAEVTTQQSDGRVERWYSTNSKAIQGAEPPLP